MNAYEQRIRFGYDLPACLEYNPQSFTFDDVEEVLAVYEGEKDGEDWRWIIRLTDQTFRALEGGCDYTGWDCRSQAESVVVANALDGVGVFLTPPLRGYSDGKQLAKVAASLYLQLNAGGRLLTKDEMTGRSLSK